jgi:CubicO group peptidase (beta-lactamase class C family)
MKQLFLFMAFVLAVVTTALADSQKGELVYPNDTCKKIDFYLAKLAVERNFSGALLIVKDGKRIFSKGYGWANKEQKIPFTSRTLASMGSITKAFTASGIMKLVEQGKLSVEDNLAKFFPDIPADKAGITLHQLLTHSAGFSEILKNDGGDYEKLETAEYLKRAFGEPLAFNPGEKAIYTNVGMSILAIIIEKISGIEYEAFLKKVLFDPIDVKRISYCYPLLNSDTVARGYNNGIDWGTHQQRFEKSGGGPYWNLKGNGGLEASLNDMYKWINAISNATVLKKSSIDKMFAKHIVEEGSNGNYFFGYGCNIAKSRRNTTMIDNGGSNNIYFARMIRLPEEGVVFYMVTNEKSANTNMVLPNVTQLYFQGEIVQDAFQMISRFESPEGEKVFNILNANNNADLSTELPKQNIEISDDMILYEVGQRFVNDGNIDAAFSLFKYYTLAFPNIVVAWNELGDVYRMKNNKEEAIKCYKQALIVRPGNPRATDNLEKLKK